MSERFPRQFGKYVLLRSMARGGMGEIYLAGAGRGGLNKLCVIKKVIADPSVADVARVNRFLDEARAVLRLSHGNLVSTFDAGNVDGELFIAMERIEGKDLREIWNRCVRTRTRIPLDVALVVGRELARALSYVHDYGDLRLVHRDVAPPNILLSYFGEVKLTDFGLARSSFKTEHTTPGVVFGRTSYLSPEQARGEVADARTDVYSLGIVTWELLTGQPYLPVAGLDPVASLEVVRSPPLEPPSSRAPWLTADVDAVILRALAPDRLARFHSAEAFRHALSEIMARVAPRADADRVAEFVRDLYRDVIAEERVERERFLTEVLPRFHGELQNPIGTPVTGILPASPRSPDPRSVEASPRADDASDLVSDAALDTMPAGGPSPVASARAAVGARASTRGSVEFEGRAVRQTAAHGLAGAVPAVDAPDADLDHSTSVTVVGPPGYPRRTPMEPGDGFSRPAESLHASALRARADYRVRRLSDDPADADALTLVWRRPTEFDTQSANAGFVGRVINHRYRIGRRIGEGGMGTVYAAEHIDIGKPVAVKVLHPRYSGDEHLVERFRREARAASRVGHPHIVEISDFGTTEDGCAFFVMERLEGADLADVLAQEGRLGPARAVHIAVQICQALQAAHDAGIIHRDLKPENIFLVARDGETDFVKVLDFGIAQNLALESGRLTYPGMAMGTPEYMSPEQAMARPVDARSDVYALGALTYEMLLGIAPFRDGPVEQVLERKELPLASLCLQRPEIPAGLDVAIRQALRPNPADRPQTMARFERELTRSLTRGRPKEVAAGALPGPDASGWLARAFDSGQTPATVTFFPPAMDAPERPAVVAGVDEEQAPGAAGADAARSEDLGATPPPLIASPEPPPIRATPSGVDLAIPRLANIASSDERTGSLSNWAGEVAPGPPRRPDRRSTGWALALCLVLIGGATLAFTLREGGALRAVHFRLGGPGATPPAPLAAAGPSPRSAPVTRALESAAMASVRVKAPAGEMDGSGPAVLEAQRPGAPRPPEVVPTSPMTKARAALVAGAPGDAVELMRGVALGTAALPEERTLYIDALVASGWQDVRSFRWLAVSRRAREALALTIPRREPSRGAHALLGEALYALRDFRGALDQFTAALAEAKGDARLKRRIIRSRRQLQGGSATVPAQSTAEQ